MKKKMYEYFVSYNFKSNNEYGFGYLRCDRPNKITCFDDLKTIADQIAKECNFESVAIINFNLLRRL